MEVKSEKAEAPRAAAPSKGPSAALVWLTPAFIGSLVLVFAGERIFATNDTARMVLTGAGVLGAVATTALRFATLTRISPSVSDAKERRSAELRLAAFSLAGLFALAIYFATTDAGLKIVGLADAEAVTRGRFESAATIAWVALIVMSALPLVFGERALSPMRTAERIEGRRVRAATLSGLSIAIVLVYSALFTYASGQLDVKADFSYFRTARPGESTRNIVKSISEPVKVMAFFPALNEVGIEVSNYLNDLAASSPTLKVEQYDRLLVPALAKEAKVTQDGILVMTRGESRETLLIGVDKKVAEPKLKNLDGDFQKALLKLLRAQRTAYLTVGHGELNEVKDDPEGRTGKNLRKLIESQNYVVKDLGLTQGLANDVPGDAGMVIVAGPSQALLPEEIAALGRYVDRGGKLFLMLDPDAKIDFEPLAAIVDLTWSKTILASDKNFVPRRRNASDHRILVTNRFSSHASVSTLSRVGRAPTLFPGAAGLDKAKGTTAQIDFAVRSLGDVFADEDGDFELSGAEKRATFNLVASVTKPISGAAKAEPGAAPVEMRAFVVGDADAFSDAALGHDPNVVLFLDGLRWLGGEESFSGAIESTEDVRIEHTKEKDVIWFYGTIFGAPLLMLGGGLALSRKKPKKKAKSSGKSGRAS